jgi:hypothetical protein
MSSFPTDKRDEAERDYLMHWRGDACLSEQTVSVYTLKIDEGLTPDDDVMRFTQVAAKHLEKEHGSPVAATGTREVVAARELHRSVSVWGKKVVPDSSGITTLRADDDDDRERLREFVRAALRLAISDEQYEFEDLSEIVRTEPTFTSDNGEYALHPRYDLTVDITAQGVPLLHVESGHTIRTTQTLANVCDPGEDINVTKVEHDTSVYDKDNRGRAVEWSDYRYCDFVEEMDGSIYEYHEGILDEDRRQELGEQNPLLVEVDYGGFTGKQLPQVLRLSTREEEVQRTASDFYSRYRDHKGVLPQRRFDYARNFIDDLTTLPVVEIGFDPSNGPCNDGFDYVDIRGNENRLQFGDDTARRVPTSGLQDGGVYHPPDEFRIAVLVPERFDSLAHDFIRIIVNGLSDLGASAGPTLIYYEFGKTQQYTDVATDVDDEFDVAVTVTPDQDQIENFWIDDPFDEFKRVLTQRGIPTQNVQKSTVEMLIGTDAGVGNERLLNILSGTVAKAGGTPWRIDDMPGDTDAFLGLDVTRDPKSGQHAGASASVVLADGTVHAAQSTMFQEGETFETDDVSQSVRDLVYSVGRDHDNSINHVTLLRDGKVVEDVGAIREQTSSMGLELDVVGVRKSGQPRIARHNPDTGEFQIPDKGVAFVDTVRERSTLLPWGMPETTQDNSVGTPRTLGIRKHSGPTDIETLTRQVYWLTEIHVGSPAGSGRSPVPIDYADQAAEFVRNGYVSQGEIIDGPAYL